jgi:diguanylate cyclase (GGDEF)-like protein
MGRSPNFLRPVPPPNSRDAFVATVAAFAGLACTLLLAGGDGRVLELLLAGAAVVAVYATDWAAPRPVSLAAGAAYLALEAGYGRFTYEEYWAHIFVLAFTIVAVHAAALVRRHREQERGALERAVEKIHDLHDEDALSLLLSGGTALTSVERELVRSRRHSHDASVLLIRPDELDDVELRRGEEGLAAVLHAVAETVGGFLRTTDVSFRHGPHDFCLLLPETTLAGARVAAERIRLAVAARQVAFGPGDLLNLSVSIGAASFPADAVSHEPLLGAAQQALSRAVELGGNRTVLSSVPHDAPRGWGLTEVARTAPAVGD